MEPQETDIDYILSHLQEPMRLTDPGFVEWLSDPAHRHLFEEIRNQREAFMRSVLESSIDVDLEYKHQQAKIRFQRKQTGWKWAVAAACTVVLLSISMIFWYSRNTAITEKGEWALLEGKKTAELVLANGERIHLENNRIELRESNGTLIVNDSNSNLSYRRDTSVRGQAAGNEAVYHTIIIPAGADYTISLADGTKVRLNCETEFRFPVEFTGKERRVFLDGEAYFQVKKAGEWPFIVETNSMRVKVTGTCFNVKSYRTEEVAHTTLVEGLVEVSGEETGDAPVRLAPSQQYCLDRRTGRAEVKTVDVSLYTGWTDGMFVFKNQRLEEIMNILSRWYTIDVIYVNESLKDLRISAHLGRYEHIDSLLDVLRAMEKVNIERKRNVVIVSKR